MGFSGTLMKVSRDSGFLGAYKCCMVVDKSLMRFDAGFMGLYQCFIRAFQGFKGDRPDALDDARLPCA